VCLSAREAGAKGERKGGSMVEVLLRGHMHDDIFIEVRVKEAQ